MEIMQLRCFVAVLQAGSFTAAARSLQLPVSSLSRHVAALETQLRVRLLERTTRRVAPTEAGRDIHARALAILAAVDETTQVAARSQQAPSGLLRLTSGIELPFAGDFLAAHPEVNLEVQYAARVVDLLHEGFDLAVRSGALEDSTLVARSLGSLRFGIFAAPAHLAAHGVPASPEHLARQPWLRMAHRVKPLSFEWHGALQRVAIRPRLVVDSPFALRDAAAAGHGLAVLPLLSAQPMVERGWLQPVMSEARLGDTPLHAVFPSARYLAPKVRAFVEFAQAALAQDSGQNGSATPMQRT